MFRYYIMICCLLGAIYVLAVRATSNVAWFDSCPSFPATWPCTELRASTQYKVPAIGFGIFWVATKHVTVLGENRLMRMIMLIELAMPSGAVRSTLGIWPL